ncbi:MAG: Stp1/IreP family PP2C-type Ser/Thr phosphatase [Gaiellaceae bacterium]
MRVLRSAGVTSTGRRRRRNEDAFVNEPPLFAVADGMGGPRAGEVASGLAAAAVKAGEAGGDGVERVVALIQEANRRVYQRSSEDANVSGMGTTMTVALVEDGGVVFGHVGDSRAYLVRDGALEQLTQDHSLVAELVRGGKLSPEEAEHHPQRSVITRALGTDPDVDVDTFTVPEQDGDIFLLCSDGLTTMIGDDTIEHVLAEHGTDLESAAEELVRLANRAGGEDNITVVAFEVTAGPPEPDERTLEQTKPMPVVVTDVPQDSGIDEIPAVDTAVVPAERARELTKASKRSFWPLLLLLLAIAAAAVALWLVGR